MKRNRKQNRKSQTSALTSSSPKRINDAIRRRFPQIRFVLTVIILMASYYALTGTDVFSKQFLPAYLAVIATVTSSALSVIGFANTVSGTIVSSQTFSMNIAYGCDALEPTFLFVVVVLAFPATWKNKILGVIGGVFLLYAINVLRLITLFLTGIYKREYFELMHIEIWQAIFIILALVLFVLWVGISERTSRIEAV